MSKPYGIRARLRSISLALRDRIRRQLVPRPDLNRQTEATPSYDGLTRPAGFGREPSAELWLRSGIP
jgi:hypothetical protein